jgi:hypothetical protein
MDNKKIAYAWVSIVACIGLVLAGGIVALSVNDGGSSEKTKISFSEYKQDGKSLVTVEVINYNGSGDLEVTGKNTAASENQPIVEPSEGQKIVIGSSLNGGLENGSVITVTEIGSEGGILMEYKYTGKNNTVVKTAD